MHLHRSTGVAVGGSKRRGDAGGAEPARPRSAARHSTRFVDGYLPALLAQASHLISGEFHVVAREAGVPVAEWRILATLTGGEPLPVGQLAATVIAPQPTVTRQLQRMEAKGLVERISHDRDRRVALVRITESGEVMAADLVRLARLHERRVLAPLGAEQADLLKRVLRALIDQHRGQGG